MSKQASAGAWRWNVRLVVVSLCAYPVEEFTSSAEIENEVEIVGGLDG
jgi:hypothetical protein